LRSKGVVKIHSDNKAGRPAEGKVFIREFEFQQRVESDYSIKPPECRQCADLLKNPNDERLQKRPFCAP
jgi:hypothetical protein